MPIRLASQSNLALKRGADSDLARQGAFFCSKSRARQNSGSTDRLCRKPALLKCQARALTAIAGNARAQSLLVGELARISESDEEEPTSLTPEDGEILEAYVSGELERRTTDSDPVLPAPSRDEN